jgi:hypothetical protein
MSRSSGALFHCKRETLSTWPVILSGLLLSTLAVVRAPWPVDPAQSALVTVAHYDRLTGRLGAMHPDTMWYARRAADALVLLALGGGYLTAALAWMAQARWSEGVLLAIGMFGVGYSAALGLYVGPILACCGFLLVTAATGLQWAMRI